MVKISKAYLKFRRWNKNMRRQRWPTASRIYDATSTRRVTSSAPSPTSCAISKACENEIIERGNIQFNVLRNALMHTMRQRHFEALHRFLMFLIVLTGTAGVGNFLSQFIGSEKFAAATALLATFDLVMDLRGKASRHDDLRRRYYRLLAKIEQHPIADSSMIASWQSKMLIITADEPDLYKVIDCIAYNNALYSLGRDESCAFYIPFWRRKLANFFTFGSVNLKTVSEIKKRKKLK